MGGRASIVAITAHALEEERKEILAAGCDDFIRKPYSEAERLDAMTRHLGVRFIYEEETTLEMASTAELTLDAAAIAALPGELLIGLEQALISLDIEAVNRVIDEIRPRDPALAEALSSAAGDFQFGRILRSNRAGHDEPEAGQETGPRT